MPLTDFQRVVLALLAQNRSPDSYLAGGAALHFAPNSVRYSDDLDFFHDSVERVATAFAEDSTLLRASGYGVQVELSQPGFVRALVRKGDEASRIDWAHDSAWRFMPPVRDELGGFVLRSGAPGPSSPCAEPADPEVRRLGRADEQRRQTYASCVARIADIGPAST